jgi:alkylation response protein AidB-like acyl-CoA dehydrogenase
MVDFRLNDEQLFLREAIETLLARRTSDHGRIEAGAGAGVWDALVEFGALDIGPEPDRLGVVELAIISRALGERLSVVPYLDSAALRYALTRYTTLEAAHQTAALAFSEPATGFAPASPRTSADEGQLNGAKCDVAFADSADLLVAPARTLDGLVLAMVPRAADGVAVVPGRSIDRDLGFATVRFDGVSAVSLIDGREAACVVPAVAQVAAVLAAAEAVGAAATLFGLASTYSGERRQFGRVLSGFQAMRHLLAELYVKLETSWSSVLYAAASLDQVEAGGVVASVAKAYASRATREVAEGSLQALGGIAFTAEHPAHLHLRRVLARGDQFGTALEHERVVAADLRERGYRRAGLAAGGPAPVAHV